VASYKEQNGFRRNLNVVIEWLRRGGDLGFFWYRFKWNLVAKHDVVLKFPLHLDIEVTEACNLKCIMCVHGITGVPTAGRIDMKFAKTMVDQAVAGGTKSIKFNWRGEPALHTGLEDLVRYAKDKGILEVQFNTNGIPFTDKRINDLVDAGLDRVIFSMDGATKETYEAIRVGSSFERLIENIKKFDNARKARGQVKPFIRIQMVRMKDNQDEVDRFVSMWRGIADDIAVKDVTDRGQGNTLYVGDQVATGRRRCNQPWQRMIVARDGKVFPCCSDWDRSYEIGDANNTPLKEIWKGDRMETLRDINRKKGLDNFDPCRSCFVLSSYEWRSLSEVEKLQRDAILTKSRGQVGRVVRVDDKAVAGAVAELQNLDGPDRAG
jgi:radical SAM protein with 4Fe4S-binding SPASM domain